MPQQIEGKKFPTKKVLVRVLVILSVLIVGFLYNSIVRSPMQLKVDSFVATTDIGHVKTALEMYNLDNNSYIQVNWPTDVANIEEFKQYTSKPPMGVLYISYKNEYGIWFALIKEVGQYGSVQADDIDDLQNILNGKFRKLEPGYYVGDDDIKSVDDVVSNMDIKTPDQWKKAYVIYLYKSKDVEQVTVDGKNADLLSVDVIQKDYVNNNFSIDKYKWKHVAIRWKVMIVTHIPKISGIEEKVILNFWIVTCEVKKDQWEVAKEINRDIVTAIWVMDGTVLKQCSFSKG